MAVFALSSTAWGYCDADGGSWPYSNGEYIYRVIFRESSTGSVVLDSGLTLNSGYYLNNSSWTLEVGKTYDFDITPSIGSGAGFWNGDRLVIWVDWTKDGDFNDSGDFCYAKTLWSGNAPVFSGSITVPDNAAGDITRMRIRLYDTYYNFQDDPCGSTVFGEVEDYNFTVKTNTGSVAGIKFDDIDGDGVKDAGEPGLSGWEIYIDENGNSLHDYGEPNDITDATGYYKLIDVDAELPTCTVAETMKSGWRQTFPGGDETHVLTMDPNAIHTNINFGNTTQPLIVTVTLSGYVTMDDGTAMEGIQVNLDFDGNTTITDFEGYYQFELDAPWTGTAQIVLPDRWYSHLPILHENITTDITEDFVCYYQYDGGDGSAGDPYQIRTAEQLNMIGHMPSHWDDHFVLTADIDMSSYNYSRSLIPYHLPTPPSVPFTGTFDGDGHVIKNLTIDVPVSGRDTGMFEKLSGTVKDLGLVDVSITNDSDIRSTGALAAINEGEILRCYSTGQVSGNPKVGGLVGNNFGDVTDCYSEAEVYGNIEVGGLIGCNWDADITNCYATGQVSGTSEIGGLLGIKYSGTITNSFWDSEIGGPDNGLGIPYNTEFMQTYSTYTSWDFENVWDMCDGSYPRLQWQPRNIADIVCPDGVEINDLITLCDEWLSGHKASDIAPDDCDGFVDYYDWAIFAGAWLGINGDGNYNAACDIWPVGGDDSIDINDLGIFINDWLSHSACLADIADDGCDGFVNYYDWTIFASAWLSTDTDGNWNATCDIWPAGGDGVIDAGDLNIFIGEWLSNNACVSNFAPDANDGYVDLRDFAVFGQYWFEGI